MGTMEQLNVRMDSDLKAKGTAALASIGVTPTEAVRALWRRAAERGEGLEKVKELVEGDDFIDACSTGSLSDGWRIVDRFRKEHGLADPKPLDLTDEELMELSYEDRGWL